MKILVVRFSLLAFASCAAMAQVTSPVAQSVQKAIEGNPEVAAKFNEFRAANDEIGVAAGAWKPHLDVTANAGRRTYTNDQLSPRSPDFYTGGARVELSQLLWDGFATKNEVDRLGHAKLLRYFEFLDATEQFGMEAAKAYTTSCATASWSRWRRTTTCSTRSRSTRCSRASRRAWAAGSTWSRSSRASRSRNPTS